MQVTFDTYTFQRNTNGKTYTATATLPTSDIRYQAQQVTTGTANSLIITKLQLPTNTALLDVVTLNNDQLSQKLLNYNGSDPDQQDIKCNRSRLTGYATDFSYDLDTQQTFYVYQYYFVSGNTLYLISFQASSKKDINAIARSISSLTCK